MKHQEILAIAGSIRQLKASKSELSSATIEKLVGAFGQLMEARELMLKDQVELLGAQATALRLADKLSCLAEIERARP